MFSAEIIQCYIEEKQSEFQPSLPFTPSGARAVSARAPLGVKGRDG